MNNSDKNLPSQVDQFCAQFLDYLNRGQDVSIREFINGVEEESRRDAFRELMKIEVEHTIVSGKRYPVSQRMEEFPKFKKDIDEVMSSIAQNSLSTLKLHSGSTGKIGLPSNDQIKTDELIGNYRILDVIGKGGMGIVYRAKQVQLNRIVALKMIREVEFAGDQHIRRFLGEAEAAAKLNHPGIVPVFDFGQIENRHYFSMAYIDGTSLSEYAGDAAMRETTAAEIVRDIALAIQYAHEKGVIHRDLKPANVLMNADHKPMVTDFGLAKAVESDSNLTHTNQVLGTPSYMPPEQARGTSDQVTRTADIYSIGGILYRLLTGSPPFRAATAIETIRSVIDREPVSPRQLNPSISKDIETICLKCLEKDPKKRYESSQQLADDLDRLLNGEPIQARPISPAGRMVRWCRRNPAIAAMSVSTFAILILGTTLSSYFGLMAQTRANELAQSNTDLQQQSVYQLEFIEDLIIEISDELEFLPAARPARRKLMRKGVEALEYISTQMKSDPRAQFDKLKMLAKLAEIYEKLGDDDGKGRTAHAIEIYQESIGIGETLITEQPQNIEIAMRLAEALEGLVEVLGDTARFESAIGYAKRALDLRKSILQTYLTTNTGEVLTAAESKLEDPEPKLVDPESIHRDKLIWAYRLYGMSLNDIAYRVAKTPEEKQEFAKKAELVFEEGVGFAKDSLEKFPSQLAESNLAELYIRYGDVYFDVLDISKSEPFYRRAYDTLKGIVDSKPDPTPNDFWSLATAEERMGNFYRYAKDWQQALKFYNDSLTHSVPSSEADPNNIRTQLDFATSHCMLAKTYRAMKNGDKTIEYYTNALNIRMPWAKLDPANREVHRLVVNSHQGIAAGHLLNRNFDQAAASYHQAIDYMKTIPVDAKQFLQRLNEYVQNQLAQVKDLQKQSME